MIPVPFRERFGAVRRRFGGAHACLNAWRELAARANDAFLSAEGDLRISCDLSLYGFTRKSIQVIYVRD